MPTRPTIQLRPVVYTTTTPRPTIHLAPHQTYVVCRVCRYEKVLGTPCGEPCV